MELGDRIWLAWWALPRTGRRGQPPGWTTLEDQHGISRGTISRLVAGHRRDVTHDMAERLAHALGVSVPWLLVGEGVGPQPSTSIPPRPAKISAPASPALQGGQLVLESHTSPSQRARDAACIFAAAIGLSDVAITVVKGMPPHPYTAEEWLALIRLQDANLRLGNRVAG